MKIVKKDNKWIKLENYKEFDIKLDMIEFLVVYYEQLAPKKFKLIRKEREFLIATVDIYNRGVDINSKEAVNIYIKEYSFTSARSVYDYRRLLINKGWLHRGKDKKLRVWEYFNLNNYPESTDFIVSIKLEEDETTGQD